MNKRIFINGVSAKLGGGKQILFSLTEKIFIGFVSGIIFGLLIGIISIPSFYEDSIILFLSFGGDVFLKLIKMLVVPIVFFSLPM